MKSGGITTFDELRNKLVVCLRDGCKESEAAAVTNAQQILSDKKNKVSEGRSAIDQAFRDLLKEMIVEKEACDDREVKINDFTCLIKISTTCAKSGLTSVSLPFILLVDIFDCLTLPVCQKIFGFVEQQMLTWKETTFDAMGKVYILRMCNDLLRRLSRSQDTVFCGQIRLFLSRYFQLDERSGLNVMSHFNVDNVTSYVKREIVDSQTLSNDGAMDMEDGEISEAEDDDKKTDKNKTVIDYNLYYRFWSLQDFFSNPNLCYSNSGWNALTTSSRIVFDVFKSYKLEALTHKDTSKFHMSSEPERMELSDSSVNETDASDRYFAKFLTNEKLLDLQLNDGEFRRTILIQFLILFQYLTSFVKFRPTNCTISERQQQWIERSNKLVYQLLEDTPPDGKEFAKSVREVLAREQHWSKWKNDGCPSFVRPGLSTEDKDQSAARKKRKISKYYTSTSDRIELGNQNLTRLWNLSVDNMSACKIGGEKFAPSVEEFFEEAVEQCDPEAQVEEEYKLVNNIVYRWRSFRVLAVQSSLIFPVSSSTSSSTTSKADFLANALSEMAKQSKDKKIVESDSVEVESIITDDSAMPLAIKEDLEEEDKLTVGD